MAKVKPQPSLWSRLKPLHPVSFSPRDEQTMQLLQELGFTKTQLRKGYLTSEECTAANINPRILGLWAQVKPDQAIHPDPTEKHAVYHTVECNKKFCAPVLSKKEAGMIWSHQQKNALFELAKLSDSFCPNPQVTAHLLNMDITSDSVFPFWDESCRIFFDEQNIRMQDILGIQLPEALAPENIRQAAQAVINLPYQLDLSTFSASEYMELDTFSENDAEKQNKLQAASGVLIGDGFLLTARHAVIENGYFRLNYFKDESGNKQALNLRSTWLNGKAHLSKEQDLAFVEAQQLKGKPFLPLTQQAPQAGEQVWLIGFPQASHQNAMYNPRIISPAMVESYDTLTGKIILQGYANRGYSGGAILRENPVTHMVELVGIISRSGAVKNIEQFVGERLKPAPGADPNADAEYLGYKPGTTQRADGTIIRAVIGYFPNPDSFHSIKTPR